MPWLEREVSATRSVPGRGRLTAAGELLEERMRALSLLMVGFALLAGGCASNEEVTEEETPVDAAAIEVETTRAVGSLPSEDSRARTERRLQLERSIDQWWIAFQKQEYGKSDGIASALEVFVNKNFDAILSDLKAGSPRFRKVAAAGLGFSGKPEAVDPLMGALQDPFADVILASLLALRQLSLTGNAVPAAPVVPYLGHSDGDIRSNAAMVLSHVATPGDGELFLPLTTAMEDASPSVRSHAAAALGVIGDSDALPFLIRALEDDKALVRIRSAYALGRINDRRAVPALIKTLDDPDNDVSKAAHKSLKVVTGQDIPRLSKEWDAYWVAQPTDGRGN